jgi:hypothetical protein
MKYFMVSMKYWSLFDSSKDSWYLYPRDQQDHTIRRLENMVKPISSQRVMSGIWEIPGSVWYDSSWKKHFLNGKNESNRKHEKKEKYRKNEKNISMLSSIFSSGKKAKHSFSQSKMETQQQPSCQNL